MRDVLTRWLLPLLTTVLLTAPLAAQDSARVVRGLSFQGNDAIDDYTLRVAIATTNSSWFARTPPFKWIGLGEKRDFDEHEFRRDVLRLTLLYKQTGFLDVQVDTVVHRTEESVSITFRITEGEPVRVTSFAVHGLDTTFSEETLEKSILVDLPLRVGAPFNRFLFQATADTIIRRLRDRGFPSVEIFRNFAVDKEARSATVSLDVVPGTRAAIGPISVVGAQRVDTSFIRKLLATRPGQRFSQEDLYQSQRNLYQTELFRFANVDIDSSRFQPLDPIVPLQVQVSEGRSHRVRSSLGYATNDCFRLGAGWTARNLFRTGRLLDISGRVSKLGVGDPFGFGLENSICSSLNEDTIGSSKANYNVTALVRQPVFFSSRNVGIYSVFAERRSEFQVYRREEVGAALTVTRTTSRRIPLTGSYRYSYGNTQATAGTFCAFFDACTPGDIDRLREKRVLATLTLSALLPRANSPLDPTRGYQAAAEITTSSRFLGSSSLQEFTRLTLDGAWYRQLKRGVVLSWHLRAGVIVSPKVSFDSNRVNFIPPDQRFYAGGPNDVRGYARNELGPVVYVLAVDTITPDTLDALAQGTLRPRFSATGGNTLGIGQVELRVPSPIFSQRMRLAFFVDAGTLYERGKTNISPIQVRFTPGVGLRIGTPLGPARLDVAYNGYDRPPGALYWSKPNGQLELIQNGFVQKAGSHLSWHFSVGQPF